MLIVLLSLFYILLYYYGIFTIGTRLSTNNLLISLNKERHKLLGTMTNYSNPLSKLSRKSKILRPIQKISRLFLALKMKILPKADLLEIYKTDNASIGNPETQEHLDKPSNPIIASFLSNRIFGNESSRMSIFH